MALTTIRFTVRKKGGALAGQTLEQKIAEFDWEGFKNTPNAEAFAKKAYYVAAWIFNTMLYLATGYRHQWLRAR